MTFEIINVGLTLRKAFTIPGVTETESIIVLLYADSKKITINNIVVSITVCLKTMNREKYRGTVITSLQLAFTECVVPATQAFYWSLDKRS